MEATSQSPAELGPVLPGKAATFMLARELEKHAARAREFAGDGPTADLSAALRELDAMRALLGGDVPARVWWRGQRDCADCEQLSEPVCTMNCSSAERTERTFPVRIACGCTPECFDRVVLEHGTCGRGGCPYGGDF